MESIKVFKNLSLSTDRNNELNEYRKIGKFTDLTLKSTDGETIKVHRNILSASCSYFKAMLDGDFIETRKDLIQLLDDIYIADLEILINYIYTGTAEVALENAENIFLKAQYFQLVELTKFCSQILIDNIKIENCLEYWRNSEISMNYDLTVRCITFIKANFKDVLEFYIMDLTAEEFKIIMQNNEKFGAHPEDLYKFITKWIKADFDNRNTHTMELIRNLNFTKISAEFIGNEIMPDEIMKLNQEFLGKMFNITYEKLQKVKRDFHMKLQSLRKVYLIANHSVYKLNWHQREWTRQLNFFTERPRLSATSIFNNHIYISGGAKRHSTMSYFRSYNMTFGTIAYLPQMLQSRCQHKIIEFKGNMYSCGGYHNKGSTEIFNYENLKWTMGPSMNENKFCFSPITTENSIYTFGGKTSKNLFSNIVEQYDPREGKWGIFARNAPETSHAALLSNNTVYCYNNIFGGNMFDLRNQKWTGSSYPVFRQKDNLNYYSQCCDVLEFNDKIFGVFQTHNNQTWGTYEYNHVANHWTNLNIPLNLDAYANIKLCVGDEAS